MLVDACIFDGELDMLEFRLRLLYDEVDRFIVVESDRNFSGEIRSFILNEGGDWTKRFAWALDKIQVYQAHLSDATTLAVDEKSATADYHYEFQQRNAIVDACAGLHDDDLIILSDVDEIPSREVIRNVKLNPTGLPKVCGQKLFYYGLRFMHRIEGTDGIWRGSIFSTVGTLRKLSPQDLRNRRSRLPRIPGAGWHFSNFGGVKQIQHKLRSFAHHVICNKPEFLDAGHIRKCIETGADPCDREDVVTEVGPDFFPDYVVEAAQSYGWVDKKEPDKPLISILHPTARPLKWGASCQSWFTRCDDPSRVEYVLVPEWNLDLNQHQIFFHNTIVEQNHGRPCLVDGYNQAAKMSHGSVLILGADDVFASPHWDTELLKTLGDKLDQEVVWHVDNVGVMTQPILTRPYYERYGYLYWHEYFGWYADEEFTDVARADGVVIDDQRNRKIFHHDHAVLDPTGSIASPVEPVYKRIVIEGKNSGSFTYNQRKAAGFPRVSYPEPKPQPLISIVHTTCRQGKWEEACRAWYENADNPDQIEYVLVPEPGRFESPLNLQIPFEQQVIAFNKGRACPVDGWNQAAKLAHGKVLVLGADDLFPALHWDTQLLETLGSKIDGEAVVWVGTADPNDSAMITHPIITKKYHDRYGFFWWPEYENWCAEVELTEVAVRDGVVLDARQVIRFDHKAPGLVGKPKDADNQKIERWYPQARKLLDRRRAEGFPRFNPNEVLGQIRRIGETGTNEPKLSILICSIPRRSEMLKRLIESLRGQTLVLPNPADVEILYLVDDHQMSIGLKRNKLIEAARGKYTCFVDDDDRVWADYIAQIFDAMEDDPDCIGMSGICTTNGLCPKVSYFSDAAKVLQGLPLDQLRHDPADPNSIPIAHVCHLSPVKRSLTSKVKFMDVSWGEDRDWTIELTRLIKTVHLLEKPVYHYDFRNSVTAAPNPNQAVPVAKKEFHVVPDKLVQDLSGLPDWALVNLVKNDSTPMSTRKICLRLLEEAKSPLAATLKL